MILKTDLTLYLHHVQVPLEFQVFLDYSLLPKEIPEIELVFFCTSRTKMKDKKYSARKITWAILP